jgi:hypothetical protein
MTLLYLLAFIAFYWVAFQKKDALSFFRALALFVSFSILVYFFITAILGFKNNFWYYPLALLVVSASILAIKFRKGGNFSFLRYKKENFDWKSISLAISLLGTILIACLAYYHWNLSAPRYYTVDAPLHFTKVRQIMESDYVKVDPVYGGFYGLTHLFGLPSESTTALLRDFQTVNIFIFAIGALYFLFYLNRAFPIKSPPLKILIFLLTTFGFFFNLFLTGFFPQSVSLVLILLFFDLYPDLSKKKSGIIALLLIIFSILVSYTYWIPLIGIFILLIWFQFFLRSPKKLNILLYLIPFFLAVLALALKFKDLAKVAADEGETYRTFFSNIILFLPFFLGSLYFIFRKWRDETKISLFVISSFLFSFLLFVAYTLGKVSSYTLTKNIFLIGPLVFYFSIYFLDYLTGNIAGKNFRSFLNFSVLAIFLIFLAFPFGWRLLVGIPNFQEVQKTETKLNSSLQKSSIWDPQQRILDVFYFNSQVYLNQDFNQMENISYFDEEKLDFLESLEENPPKEFDRNFFFNSQIENSSRIMIVADLKTSKWMDSLTGIWSPAADDLPILSEKVFDYDQWKANHENPYLIIFDTQTANKWLWLNQDRFKMQDFKVLYKKGNNYLLKLKESA